MKENLFKASNVVKSYKAGKKDVIVNNDISLNSTPGEMIVITGNSGAGKTTFLNLISGLDNADSGEVLWGDYNITGMTSAERADFRLNYCALILQFFELLKTQDAWSNAALPLKFKNKSRKEIESVLKPLFEEFEIDGVMHKKVHELSGGEKQRTAIIRSLTLDPVFIIADEITASLDKELSKKVYEHFKGIIKTKNSTGIFVSHDGIIFDYADTIYNMQEGKLIRS